MLHGVDLSKFKVVYEEKVLRAVALSNIDFQESEDFTSTIIKPNFLDVLVINSNGNLEILHDKAWRFQFIPEISKD